MCNLVGSFFQSFTVGGTLARTVVQEASGGKTQLVTILSNLVNSDLIFPLLKKKRIIQYSYVLI
jgi:MFS superfamily sulfate permease-like transporter